MMLDLFITHYKEPWEVGAKGFWMLASQQGVDWSQVRVTLVHDGTECFPAEKFAGFPFTVRQVSIPHGGIAAARNWCIDNSDAEWIKWNDFDDAFFTAHSLKDLTDHLSSDKFDLIWYELLVDDWMDKRKPMKTFLRKERDPIFVHNKLFRRQFLLDHKIRFNEELIWCEDSAFMSIIEMEIDHQRIGKVSSKVGPIYMYICRNGSLCNRPEIFFANLQSFFKRHCYVADAFLERGRMDEYYAMCVRVMGDSYYTLCKAPGITEDKSDFERKVWDWFDEHREAFWKCRPEMFRMVIKAVNRERDDGGEITEEEFIGWILRHERGDK